MSGVFSTEYNGVFSIELSWLFLAELIGVVYSYERGFIHRVIYKILKN